MSGFALLRGEVLVVSYAFPPAAYVGVFRTLKHCKYLAEFGWLPVVLTAKPSKYAHRDDSLCAQIPSHVEVIRTIDFDPSRILEALSRIGKQVPESPANGKMPSGAAERGARRAFWSRCKKGIREMLVESPDAHVFWAPIALLAGIRILLTRRIDVIYSTSPPHSAHFPAYWLSKLFRKPLVLDFRDPWTMRAALLRAGGQLPPQRRWQAAIKRRLVEHASAVIAVSRGERDDLRKEFPETRPEKFLFITNGFDPPDFPLEVEARGDSCLIVTHAGTIYPGVADEFFAALRALLLEFPSLATKLRIRQVGEVAAEYGTVVRELAAAGVLEARGLQPHATALRLMAASDVLLILLGGSSFPPSEIPAKTFEYLRVGKPILAVTRQGDLSELLQESALGIVVGAGSAEAVKRALWALCADHERREPPQVNSSFIQKFERRALAQSLAHVLSAAAATR